MALLQPIESYRNTYINLAEALEELIEFKDSGLFSNCEKRVFWSIFNRLELHVNHPEVVELKPILEEYEELVQTNPTSKAVDEFCIKTMRKILCNKIAAKSSLEY